MMSHDDTYTENGLQVYGCVQAVRPRADILLADFKYPSILSLPRGQGRHDLSMDHIQCIRLNIATTKMTSYNNRYRERHGQYPSHTETKAFLAIRQIGDT